MNPGRILYVLWHPYHCLKVLLKSSHTKCILASKSRIPRSAYASPVMKLFTLARRGKGVPWWRNMGQRHWVFFVIVVLAKCTQIVLMVFLRPLLSLSFQNYLGLGEGISICFKILWSAWYHSLAQQGTTCHVCSCTLEDQNVLSHLSHNSWSLSLSW